MPLADSKTSGLFPSGPLAPAAMKPAAVRFSTLIWSPGRSGSPVVEASVQVRPSGLVQMESGPRATQAPLPPATLPPATLPPATLPPATKRAA